MSAPAGLFRFVQVEHPWLLGVDPGRYVVRPEGGGDPTHVLVVATLGAPERRRRGGRRPRRAAPEPDPTPVATTRSTIIDAVPAASEAAAETWLAEAATAEVADRRVDAAFLVLTRATRAQRLVSADASITDPRREQALSLRVGIGRGDQVADGRWESAIEVALPTPERRARRSGALRPQERLAAALAGREPPLVCAELILRARADLDAGRAREAALELRIALEAALAELAGAVDADRLGELRDRRAIVAAAANAALEGPLPAEAHSGVAEALGRVEAALRARSAGMRSGPEPGAAQLM